MRERSCGEARVLAVVYGPLRADGALATFGV